MIEVIKTGLLSSIQDFGRFGFRDQGVPLSGAMDQYSAAFANQLLGNQDNTPLIEFALQGPTLKFHKASRIALAGPNWQVELDGKSVEMKSVIELAAGSILNCISAKAGMYAYLAIAGGFELETALGSASFYPNILDSAKLKMGQGLTATGNTSEGGTFNSKVIFEQGRISDHKLQVFKGAEYHQLKQEQIKSLFETDFKISKDSNRMASILEHDLSLEVNEITTAPVEAGTVQLTPSGKMVVLMRDAQTTGGYARILQLSPMAINQLAQKRAGEKVKMELITNYACLP